MFLFRSDDDDDDDDDDCPLSCVRRRKRRERERERVQRKKELESDGPGNIRNPQYILFFSSFFLLFLVSVGRLRIVELLYMCTRICSIGELSRQLARQMKNRT